MIIYTEFSQCASAVVDLVHLCQNSSKNKGAFRQRRWLHCGLALLLFCRGTWLPAHWPKSVYCLLPVTWPVAHAWVTQGAFDMARALPMLFRHIDPKSKYILVKEDGDIAG